MKWYVGMKPTLGRVVFQAQTTPTQKEYPMYISVVGPFRTKRGATFHAAVGANNPHVQTVSQAERLAKKGTAV